MKRIVITGAGSGIGRATALRLARRGVTLVLVARSEPALDAVAEEVRSLGADAVICPADVSDRGALAAALAGAVADGVDAAISNAGALVWGPFSETSPEDFDRTIAVTFTGAVNFTRSVLPALERSGGSLVVVGSIVSELAIPDLSAYVAAKQALRGFVVSLEAELRRAGSPVAVSLVKPGHVSTPLWERSTSATGERLALPPLSYRVEEVAAAIERVLEHPSTEITVGGLARAEVLAFKLARPLYDLAAPPLSRVLASGEKALSPGNLWEPAAGPGLRAAGHPGRRSLLEGVRNAVSRLRST